MRRLVIFAALFSLFAFNGLAQQKAGRGGQTLIEPRHWIYDSLQILEQESGIVQFSDQAPLNLQQVRAMLGEIDYDSLSQPGKVHYDSIIEWMQESAFSVSASIVQVRAEPELNLEGYVKTNSSAPWVYDRFEKKHFLECPITISVADYASFYADIFAGINKSAAQDNDTYFNVPYNSKNFDVNFPHKAYGSIGYAFTDTVGFNIRVTNMSQAFGRAETGSIIQAEYLTDATSAALSVYSPIVQYSGAITQYNNHRYLYSHKVDARIGKKFQISFMEAALPYGDMDLRFFNPMMFLHNYASWLDYQKGDGSDVGSFFGIKANFSPIKRLRIFALWSMTQFQLPVELSEDDTDKDNYVPNAMGVQLGLESYIPLKGGHLHFDLEGYYAQPYLYINSSPNWSFVKTSSESNSGAKDFYEWIGSRYGPDTVAASLHVAYEVPKKWSAGFKYLFLARGKLSDPNIFTKAGWGPRILNPGDDKLQHWVYPFISYPNGQQKFNGDPRYKNGRNLAAPTGTPEFVNVITLYGNYRLNEWLDFMTQPSLAIILNSGHEKGKTELSFEFVLGARIKFTKIKKNNAGKKEYAQNVSEN